MSADFKTTADAILNKVITSSPRAPGVVAMATDHHRNIYEGAAGLRRLDRSGAMTTDTVFAIFSTTKAITGTAVLQLVEEGKLDLGAPAKTTPPISAGSRLSRILTRMASRSSARRSAT